MYKIGEFAKMVGVTRTTIRFYEKQGIISPKRLENGYRVYSHFDAFKINAFKTLLNYGFSVAEATKLYKKLPKEEFIDALKERKGKIEKEIEALTYRLNKVDRTLDIINKEPKDRISIHQVEDYLYIPFSKGLDFTPSLENHNALSKLVAKPEISYYARKIPKEEILRNKSVISISYIQVVSKKNKDKLTEYEKQNVKIFPMGKCIIYYRSITREESSLYDSYTELLEYLELNRLEIRGDILLLPTFLNLGDNGYDIEKLFIPIK